MAMKMDRRTFLKTTAAAAVAVSVTSLLAGCGGDNGYDVGEYRVYFSVRDFYQSGSTGKDCVELDVKVKGVSNTLTLGKAYSNYFEADGFTLLNGDDKLNVVEGFTATCPLKFEKDHTDSFAQMMKGEEPFIVTIKLSAQNKVFAINLKNGAITAKN